MSRFVLDAGMFIALGNGEPRARLQFKRILERRDSVVTNANVVAQVWRGGRRSAVVARDLKSVAVEPVDEQLARNAGQLCGVSGTSDIVDATVVAMCEHGDVVLTSDPDDIRHLARYVDRRFAVGAVTG